jgi:hypothetical protein
MLNTLIILELLYSFRWMNLVSILFLVDISYTSTFSVWSYKVLFYYDLSHMNSFNGFIAFNDYINLINIMFTSVDCLLSGDGLEH